MVYHYSGRYHHDPSYIKNEVLYTVWTGTKTTAMTPRSMDFIEGLRIITAMIPFTAEPPRPSLRTVCGVSTLTAEPPRPPYGGLRGLRLVRRSRKQHPSPAYRGARVTPFAEKNPLWACRAVGVSFRELGTRNGSPALFFGQPKRRGSFPPPVATAVVGSRPPYRSLPVAVRFCRSLSAVFWPGSWHKSVNSRRTNLFRFILDKLGLTEKCSFDSRKVARGFPP